MPSKILEVYLRLDAVVRTRVTITVFLDGVESGQLYLLPQNYQLFGAALMFGSRRMRGRVLLKYDQIDWDADGIFHMPSTRNIKTVVIDNGPV